MSAQTHRRSALDDRKFAAFCRSARPQPSPSDVLVSKIKEANADYLMWGGLHTEGGLIVRQMRDQGMNTVMISGDGEDQR